MNRMSDHMPAAETAMAASARSGLERRRLRIGIIPLTDCAVIVAAKEKGFFARHGVEVEITREATWAGIRDKLAAGVLDAAHMLAGIPIATALGIEALDCPMVTAMSLGLNGNAVTVSPALFGQMHSAAPEAATNRQASSQALRHVLERRKQEKLPPPTIAVVHPFSSHNYLLRYWLAAAGIDPSRDVRMTVVPPPRMVDDLRHGKVDGFCVGEPWSALAVSQGVGCAVATGYDIWQNAPEKVLGVTKHWAQTNPRTHVALIKALIEAAQWAEAKEHREELASMLCNGGYVGVPREVVALSLRGEYRASNGAPVEPLADFHVLFRHAATFPWRSHAAWFVTQMIRWGDVERVVDIDAVVREVYLPDVYRAAANELGILCPTTDGKDEGTHDAPWPLGDGQQSITMGADRFCDGASFDPAWPLTYLSRFQIHTLSAAWRHHFEGVASTSHLGR